jgi:oxaloacetate decarboxylase alpha subunit
VAPVDANVMDRIMNSPRAQEVLDNPPPDPDLETLMKQYDTEDPDELILRASVPQADIDKMRAAGSVRRDYPLLSTPELEQVRKLMGVATMPVVEIKAAGLDVTLRR